jgi:hypothetical protein
MGESLHVLGVEQAATPVGISVRREQAAADIGVERGHFDAQAAGGLGTLEHPVHRRGAYLILSRYILT